MLCIHLRPIFITCLLGCIPAVLVAGGGVPHDGQVKVVHVFGDGHADTNVAELAVSGNTASLKIPAAQIGKGSLRRTGGVLTVHQRTRLNEKSESANGDKK